MAVLVSLMSNELAQSLCHIFALICRRRNQNWRTSQTKRCRHFNCSICRTNAIHVQDAKILHEPIVKKPLLHCSSTTFKKNGAIVKHSETIHIFLPLPSPSSSPPSHPHKLIRVFCHSHQKWCPTQKKLRQRRKTRRSGGPSDPP